MNKVIGIIGGAGPEASAELYQSILTKVKEGGGRYDWEFPHIIIDSFPFSDLVKLNDSQKLVGEFRESYDRLKKAGAQYILVACNTLYLLIDKEKYDIVDLPQEICNLAKTRGCKKIGLMATSTTVKKGVYNILTKDSIDLVSLDEDDQEKLDDLILNVVDRKNRVGEFKNLLDKLRGQGVEVIIIGCTDLSLYLSEVKGVKDDLIDSMDVLAELAVNYWQQNK